VANTAISAICRVLTDQPGRRRLVAAARSLQRGVYGGLLLQGEQRDCVGWIPHMLDLSLSIYAADVGGETDWAARQFSGGSGILIALSATLPDVAHHLAALNDTRADIMRSLAVAIEAHASVLITARERTPIETMSDDFMERAWTVLLITFGDTLARLRREIARTRAADAFVALARAQLGAGYGRCQHSLHLALTIAASPSLPDDRAVGLIDAGILEVFVRLYVGGNASHSGPLGQGATGDPGALASPYAEFAAKIATLAWRPALRPVIRDRLAPLLPPMLLALDREARSHDYGPSSPCFTADVADMHDDVVELARSLALPDPSVRPLRCAVADCIATGVKACARCKFVCFCGKAHQLECVYDAVAALTSRAWPQHRISCKLLAI